MPEPEENDEAQSPRPFWSGTITFGLVAVPVALFPATRRENAGLRMLGPSGAPVRRRYECSADGQVMEDDDLVRGFEVESGRYVVVTDEELQKLAPEKSSDIDLKSFVPASELDPVQVERPYFLAPSGQSTKAYRLLAGVLEQNHLAGIGRFVMRGKEHLVAIVGEGGILRAQTLRFFDEVRQPDGIGVPKRGPRDSKAFEKFEKAIAARSKGSLVQTELEDPRVEALLDLVEKKRGKGVGVVKAPRQRTEEKGGEPIDLLEVLKRSMRQGGPIATRRKGSQKSRRTSAKGRVQQFRKRA